MNRQRLKSSDVTADAKTHNNRAIAPAGRKRDPLHADPQAREEPEPAGAVGRERFGFLGPLTLGRFLGVREIERFLQSRAEWILAALKRYEKRREAAPLPTQFTNGETLQVFGEATPIRVAQGSKICGAYVEKTLFLTVKDPDDQAQRRRAAEQWAAAYLSDRVKSLCEKAERDFSRYRIPRPAVRFRRMTSRWGSCNTRTAVLTFNNALISAPLPAVEYVVYHEFAHLLYPNHSPDFYAQVAVFLPDWKARRALLRNIPCRFF